MAIEQLLRDLVKDGRSWVHLATVDSVEAHPAWGYLVNVTTRPGGREVQARLAAWGGGSGRGGYGVVAAGDEVLVVFPDGDANGAIVIAGLVSNAAPKPSTWANDRFAFVHPNGVETRLTGATVVQKVVTEDSLPKLRLALTELSAALKALGLPTVATDAFLAEAATGFRSAALKTE